jgi:hypothetical protein
MRSASWRALVGAALVAPFLVGCQAGPDFEIDYEMYQLDNGLSVVLHEDRSDPIAAWAQTARRWVAPGSRTSSNT